MTAHVKIRFQYENSEGGIETESMWATTRPDGYEIDNIPFYVKELALGDLVAAETDENAALWFTKVLRSSMHSTIRLWFAREEDVQPTRDRLRDMGCPSEVSDLPRLVAVDVPPHVLYDEVRAVLDAGEKDGKFEYQEGCLGSPTIADSMARP